MKEVKLHNWGVALVDDDDYERVINFPHPWRASKSRGTDSAYVYSMWGEGGVHHHISLHRFILGVFDKNIYVDHIDRNPLNNCKNNLRIATYSQNQWNRAKVKTTFSSMYKGVFKNRDRWRSEIFTNGQKRYLGTFSTEIEAARAYDKAARELHGEFAFLNFPNE